MKKTDLLIIVSDFTKGLLKKAKVKHAGNCLMMSRILKEYLSIFWGVNTEITNAWVKTDDDNVNHYYLTMKNGTIIDATASQFKGMPKVYIGTKPKNYYPRII